MIEGQRVLVTGATGQVARPLAQKLNEKNEVWAAARFSDPDAKAELEAMGIRTAKFSMGESDLSGLPDVDYVFHCGANVDPKSPEIGMTQNAEGSGFLMQRYADAKGFLHMSSSSVYRVPPSGREPTTEDHELGGHASYAPHYAMSKLAAEIVNLGGDEIASVEEIIAWVEELTGLSMKIETGAVASWGMKVLDNAKRMALGGPCRVPWKEGVRSALQTRRPDALV